MREMLFRGKRLDNGEWVESGSFSRMSGDGIALDYYIGAGKPAIYTIDEHDNILGIETVADVLHYKVDPNTVGQYTGLTDKNGKKIFEGDIIQIPNDYNEYGRNAGEIYEIYFCFGGFRLKPKYSQARGYWLEDDRTVEIIGNIHDNPELLSN